ncbi:MAG: peptidoglycan DD-metalloendopeptidase family protein [Polyangiaceae bacterium]|jgi:murein DD-endopeptidase MepM/ murein hydrolase activator NlpD
MSHLLRFARCVPFVVAACASSMAWSDTSVDRIAAADPMLALAAFDRKIADLDLERARNQSELGDTGRRLSAIHALVVARGREFYRLTRVGILPLGGGFEAFVAQAMRVEHERRRLSSDLKEEARLRARAGELAASLTGIDRDRVTLVEQRTDLEFAQSARQADLRRQQAFERAFESSTGANDYVALTGGPNVTPEIPAGGFASARGRLLFPLAGRADVRPAHRDGVDGPGLELVAPAGTPVRAVFAGRVAFADAYGPFGRIVILDHGDHYYTVSGNLADMSVKIGQEVAASDRIGTVGDDGNGPMLYFEVRHGSHAIAPAPWLGL